MLKNVFTFCLFLLMSICLKPVYAQISVQTLVSKLSDSVKEIEETGGQVLLMHIDKIDFAQEKTLYYTLKAASKYGIIAVGDNERVLNIDLTVSDDKALPVGVDNRKDNIALIKVQPKYDGIFVIRAKASTMIEKNKDGFFGIIIMRYPPKEKTNIE